jgi:hypothetical protein
MNSLIRNERSNFSQILKFFYSFAFIFICLFLLRSENYASAANNAPIAPTSTDPIGSNNIDYNWTSGGGGGTYYVVEQSTNGLSYNFIATTTLTSYRFLGLLPNTRYWFRVASADGISATSSYVTSSPVYTRYDKVFFEASGGTNNFDFNRNSTTSTLQIRITNNFGNNPSSTLYSVVSSYNGALHYYDSLGNPTTTQVFYTSSTMGSNYTIRGLTSGTNYPLLYIESINSDGLSSFIDYESGETAPNPVSSISLSNPTINSLNLSFGTSSNTTTNRFAIYSPALGKYLNQSGVAVSSVNPSDIAFTSSSWGNNINLPGLATNTAYQFEVHAFSFSTSSPGTYTSSTSSPLYTLASVPSITNILRSNDNNQITVSWSGDATSYYLENITTGVSSGWTSGFSYTFSNVPCNTSYSFKIKGRNGDGVETDYSSTVLSSSSCGGGGAVEPSKPVLSNLALPAVTVKSRGSGQASFEFNIKNATQVAISSEPTFANVGWMTLQNPFIYTWPQGKNISVLYIKFRSVDGGESQVFKVSADNMNRKDTNSDFLHVGNSTPTSSAVIFVKMPKSLVIKTPQIISFSYKFINNTTSTQKVKVVRTLWLKSAPEKRLGEVYGFRVVKAGKSFIVSTSQYLNKKIPPGNYYVRVEILDQNSSQVLASNSFDFKIQN